MTKSLPRLIAMLHDWHLNTRHQKKQTSPTGGPSLFLYAENKAIAARGNTVKKNLADALALSITAKAVEANPTGFLMHSGDGAANANMLADFVKTLSERFQVDISGDVMLSDLAALTRH